MWPSLAISIEKMNQYEASLEFYDSTIQQNPEIADNFYHKGIIY